MNTPETVEQLQDEVVSLITAWADRGVSPSESAMVLAGLSNMLLAKLGYSLGEFIVIVADGWRRNNGKL